MVGVGERGDGVEGARSRNHVAHDDGLRKGEGDGAEGPELDWGEGEHGRCKWWWRRRWWGRSCGGDMQKKI